MPGLPLFVAKSSTRSALTVCALAAALMVGGCSSPSTDAAETTRGVGDDGCSDQLASGVSVQDVDVYQTVQVPVVKAGTFLSVDERDVDIVAGKGGVARIGVDVPSGWSDQDVSARVVIRAGDDAPVTSYERVTLTGTAGDAPGQTGGFTVDLPAEAVTTDAEVSVQVVNCADTDDGSGADAADQAPVEGALGARETGGIKVNLVPFTVAGFVPDTSDAVVEGYRNALLAMYPVTDVTITVGEIQDGGDEANLGNLLVDVGRVRDSDNADKDVYYYGMVTGAATRDEYCDDCITGTSESGGTSSVGFAIGASFGDQKSEDTFTHELGHAHGLDHAPCGNVDMVDPDFPNEGGLVGVAGFDRRTSEFLPDTTADFMGYCFPRWMSDYNYQKLLDRVALINGQTSQT